MAGSEGTRLVSFAKGAAAVETRLLPRAAVGEAPVVGPAIIESYDTTIVVPPGCTARAAGAGCIGIELGVLIHSLQFQHPFEVCRAALPLDQDRSVLFEGASHRFGGGAQLPPAAATAHIGGHHFLHFIRSQSFPGMPCRFEGVAGGVLPAHRHLTTRGFLL
jgi:hypothetical protein